VIAFGQFLLMQPASVPHAKRHASAENSASAWSGEVPREQPQPQLLSPNRHVWVWQVSAFAHVPSPLKILPHVPSTMQTAYDEQFLLEFAAQMLTSVFVWHVVKHIDSDAIWHCAASAQLA
jgi:hypothetical protein